MGQVHAACPCETIKPTRLAFALRTHPLSYNEHSHTCLRKTGLDKWAKCMRRVRVTIDASVDLAPLGVLANLRTLDLTGARCSDLTPLSVCCDWGVCM